MELNYWKGACPHLVEGCPCDAHFVEYLERQSIGGKTIFHFGTGGHHHVGTACSEQQAPSEVLGVTASIEEYQAYIDLIIRRPEVARYYKAMFVDIYTLTPRTLPSFDLITLFHLGEFYDPVRSAYAWLNDATLFELALAKLNPDGRLFFYTGSHGFGRTEPIIAASVSRGKIEEVDRYKTLLVYARAGEAARAPAA